MAKIKDLSLKKVTIECHPLALAAHAQGALMAPQFSADLGVDLLQQLQSADPLIVMKSHEPSHYFFISGWTWLIACRKHEIDRVKVVEEKNLSDKEVELRAWSYILSNLLKAPNRHSILAYSSQVLDAIPKELSKVLLVDNHGRTGRASTSNLSGESIDAIKHQLTKNEQVYVQESSVLDEILKS